MVIRNGTAQLQEVGGYVTLWVMGRKVRGWAYYYVPEDEYWIDVRLRLQSTVTGRVYEQTVALRYKWEDGVFKYATTNL